MVSLRDQVGNLASLLSALVLALLELWYRFAIKLEILPLPHSAGSALDTCAYATVSWRRHPDGLAILAPSAFCGGRCEVDGSNTHSLRSFRFSLRTSGSHSVRLRRVEKPAEPSVRQFFQWRRHPDSNRGMTVLQTVALATWRWRLIGISEARRSLTFLRSV